MKKLLLLIALCGLTTACANMAEMVGLEGDEHSEGQRQSASNGSPMNVVNIKSSKQKQDAKHSAQNKADSFGSLNKEAQYIDSRGLYDGAMLTKHVGDYVQNMAQDLISNMEYLSDKTPVAITNFALIDSDLSQTNLLGFQLAESFIHELHKFRIPVIDYKATEYIRVTEQGDFMLTRDFLELKSSVAIEYVLTGTMTKHQGGYLVNARILGLESKAVVSSAQMMIPFYVVDALLPSDKNLNDGIKLGASE
jgi:TolB-like protein